MLQPWWDEISLVQCSPCRRRPRLARVPRSNRHRLPQISIALCHQRFPGVWLIGERTDSYPSLLLATYEAFCSGLVKLSSALPSCRPPRACQTGRHNYIMLGPKSLVDNCTTPLTRGSSVGLHTALALDP